MATTSTMVQAAMHLPELVNRVISENERIVITRRGKPIAALVSITDLRQLEVSEATTRSNADEATHPIMRASGGWADRMDLDDLVEEIYADRASVIDRKLAQ